MAENPWGCREREREREYTFTQQKICGFDHM